jgi:hypothetical protein
MLIIKSSRLVLEPNYFIVISQRLFYSILFIIGGLSFAKATLQPPYNLLGAATNGNGIFKYSA